MESRRKVAIRANLGENLPGLAINRRYPYKSSLQRSQALWFTLTVKHESPQRATRLYFSPPCIDGTSNSRTPDGDEKNVQMIDDFHKTNVRRHIDT